MENWIFYFIIGIISGFFIGLVGIGAGVIVVPGLTLAGMTIKQAVTTGLFLQAIPQTLPGFFLFRKKGHFELGPTLVVLLGSLIGVFAGAYIHYEEAISDRNVYLTLSALLFLSGVHVFYRNVWNQPLEKKVKKKDGELKIP